MMYNFDQLTTIFQLTLSELLKYDITKAAKMTLSNYGMFLFMLCWWQAGLSSIVWLLLPLLLWYKITSSPPLITRKIVLQETMTPKEGPTSLDDCSTEAAIIQPSKKRMIASLPQKYRIDEVSPTRKLFRIKRRLFLECIEKNQASRMLLRTDSATSATSSTFSESEYDDDTSLLN